MIDTIVDLYHQNSIDLPKAKANGVLALIHKATEGTRFKDNQYHDRRKAAKDLGFLWGSYHFSSAENPADQVDAYLNFANPTVDEVMSLDWEPSSHGEDMSGSQANDFVHDIETGTGRYPILYGSNFIREKTNSTMEYLPLCPLWYARYGPRAIGIPLLWKNWTLWQYTDGNVGPQPHYIIGVGHCDRSYFDGNADQLKAAWPLTRST